MDITRNSVADLPPPPQKRAIRKAGEPVRDLSLPDVPSDERDPYSLQATAGYLSDDEEGVRWLVAHCLRFCNDLSRGKSPYIVIRHMQGA